VHWPRKIDVFAMVLKWRSQRWFSAAVFVLGVIALVVVAYAFLLLRTNFATAGFSLLIVVVLISTLGSYVSSVLLAVVAMACLAYFFAQPIFSLRVEQEQDIAALSAFLITSIIITGLAAKVRRKSEEELRDTRAQLTRFARVAILGELTASIAHEINQPLAGVVSSGDACRRWLANQPPNIERANQSLERIIRDADRASGIIERVRGLVKNTSNQKGAVSVDEAVREVILLTRGEAELNRIRVDTKIADNLPLVWADRIELQQVCLNLIINAIESVKDLSSGPRRLLVEVEKDQPDGVLLTFSDTGAGIDPEKAKYIFDALYTTKPEGMGLGLAISRSIVEAHGGRLWASLNVPRGTKFQFTIPQYHEKTS
jgi:C4-dicarboxylate-specific signal transduction histidine kinase